VQVANHHYPRILCILFLVCLLSGCDGDKTFRVRTQIVELDSLSQLEILQDSLVKPYLYTHVDGFDELPFHEAKPRFIAAVLPAILVAKHERETDQKKYKKLSEKKNWTKSDSILFSYLMKRYQVRSTDEPLIRMQTLPNSIVLAQAAVETGWGKSRFFTKAKNVFGIWSFSEKDSRIEANAKRGDKKVFLRSYPDMSGSIRDYFDVLSRSNAFRGLRIIRETTDNPFHLIPYLKNYSERKSKYTRLLKKIIEQNDLTRYDHYQIDPEFLIEEEDANQID
jgi:Bax protein